MSLRKLAVLFALIAVIGFGSVKAQAAEFTFSGFVDASYLDAQYENSSFTLDEVELDINGTLADNLTLRADLNYREVDGTLTADTVVEQGFITYGADLGGTPVDFTFGKFNIPMGWELLDPVDMYQYSHSLLFNFAIPTNVTGLMGTLKPADMLDLNLYVVNGWDVNSDYNNSKTIGGRLGITPAEGYNIGLSFITGKETCPDAACVVSEGAPLDIDDDVRTVFDIDFTITVVDKLTIGGEYNMGEEENQSAVTLGDDAEWTAYMIMGNYEVTDDTSVTLRYDSFDDEDGTRLGNGVEEEQESYTFAVLHSLGENAGVLAEYSVIESDVDVFDDMTEDSVRTVAVEFTYSF